MKIHLITSWQTHVWEWPGTLARDLIRTYERHEAGKNISISFIMDNMEGRPDLTRGDQIPPGWYILSKCRKRIIQGFRVFTDRIEIALFNDTRKAEVEKLLREDRTINEITTMTKISTTVIKKIIAGTELENIAKMNGKKKMKHNGRPRGTGHKFSHLTKEQRETVERLLIDGFTVKQVSYQTGFSVGQINNYIVGTPFDQIAEKNLARYHFQKEHTRCAALRSVPQEILDRIETLVLVEGCHGSEVVRRLIDEGFPATEHIVYSCINSNETLKDVSKQNWYLNWLSHPKSGENKPRSEYIYNRYYLLTKRDGILLIDRMSRRFSTKRYWVEYGIKSFFPHQIEQARKECNRLNSAWQKKCREKYGEDAAAVSNDEL